MSIQIGKYDFEGKYPFDGNVPDIRYIENRAGVYAILTETQSKLYVVDIGETATLQERLAHHDRNACWHEHNQGRLVFAVYYTPNMQQSGRMEIEQELRAKYSPSCGQR
ncbi:MAG: hypothetical protein OEV59_10085 [Deltaproteobacteria bacterium]|nr:hypothetical protein [Deltaproteobacteria bacterium]